jgi:asparagine synthase (glutamine-hydrolysing)
MCGIVGFVSSGGVGDFSAPARAMIDAIAYRGPDGSDVWSDAEAGVALGHRRLAIVDLTPTGAQPMVSADGRWVISYNGEVYNAEAIAGQPDMAGIVRRGTSDTEVILESVALRGLDATLTDLNGMFAIALWDRATRTLHLVRDRLGIKPLFYAASGQGISFASELKSFAAAGFVFPLDESSVASFLRFGYVPAPHTIFRGVAKVMPGEVVSFGPDRALRRRTYWSLDAIATEGLARPFAGSDAEAIDALNTLLGDAVSGNMISDVPLGAFLSGGVDSSAVVALMVAARQGGRRVPWQRARRVDSHRRRRARGRAAARRDVRRAFRRFLADSDLRDLEDDPRARHRRAQRRRRRRIVCRLQSLYARRRAVGEARSPAGGPAPRCRSGAARRAR